MEIKKKKELLKDNFKESYLLATLDFFVFHILLNKVQIMT